jgi:hypothetical protein
MAVLGLILAVAAGAYVAAAFFTTSDQATLSVLGMKTTMSVGHFVALGVLAGLVFALGLMMLFGGIGRAARRRRETREVVVSSRTEAEELRAENERLARELEERRARAAGNGTAGERGGATDSTSLDDPALSDIIDRPRSTTGGEVRETTTGAYVARHGGDPVAYPDEPAVRNDVTTPTVSPDGREAR